MTDKIGRCIATRNAMEEIINIIDYDEYGNPEKNIPPNAVTDPYNFDKYSSYVLNNTYNFLGQVDSSTSPDREPIEYRYDQAGNIRFVKHGNHQTNYDYSYKIYDAYGRIVKIGEITNANFSFYEAPTQTSGNPDDDYPYPWTSGRSNRIVYLYDSNGYPDARNLKGRLVAAQYTDENSGSLGITGYSYNDQGQIEWVKQKLPGNPIGIKTISYEYDSRGNLLKTSFQTGTNEAFFTYYEYDNIGNLSTVKTSAGVDNPGNANIIRTYTYYGYGPVETVSVADGLETATFTYNIQGKLNEVNSVKFSEEFTYFVHGNIDTLIITQDGISDKCKYSYDDSKRFIIADAQGTILRDEGYLYDKNGNILGMNKTSAVIPSQNYFYNPGNNQLNHIQGQDPDNFQYDNVGNILEDDQTGLTIVYDYRNLPRRHEIGNNPVSVALLAYDASGMRISKALTNELEDYYYVGEPEYNYLVKDYLGSVRLVLDESGDVQESYWYSPYGEVINATISGQSPSEMKFTGHEEENEGLPGFYYAGARYYNSSVGIWYSGDPAGQGFTPYLYAGNNPLLYIDEDGEFWHLIVGAAINIALNWDDIANTRGGFWKALGYGAVGAIGAQLATYGGGTYLNNLMWGMGEGGVTNYLNGVVGGDDGSTLWRRFYQGAVMGGAFATVTSGWEAYNNYKDGYGFRTNAGALEYYKTKNDFESVKDILHERYGLENNWQVLNDGHPYFKDAEERLGYETAAITRFDKKTGELLNENSFLKISEWQKSFLSIQGPIYHEELHRKLGISTYEKLAHGQKIYGGVLNNAGKLHLNWETIKHNLKYFQSYTGKTYWKFWNLLPSRF